MQAYKDTFLCQNKLKKTLKANFKLNVIITAIQVFNTSTKHFLSLQNVVLRQCHAYQMQLNQNRILFFEWKAYQSWFIWFSISTITMKRNLCSFSNSRRMCRKWMWTLIKIVFSIQHKIETVSGDRSHVYGNSLS